MKIAAIALIFCFFLPGCRNDMEVQAQTDYKDLNWSMMDLRIYLENLGEHIRDDRLNDASWLLEGTDSILQHMSERFPKHRKLSKPFEHFYRKDLKDPINEIRDAIESNDTSMAYKNYRIVVKKCNGCHIDHDIEKTVRE